MTQDQETLAAEAPEAADAPAPRRRNWRRRLAKLGLVLTVIGLLGGGMSLGWLLRGWVPSGGVGTTTVVVERPVRTEAQTVTSGTLPNVLGLEADEARQAYADSGVDASAIVVREAPYVAEPGTVIEQRPAPASKIPRGPVQILVARRATMPSLVGVPGDEARARLDEIGVGATTRVRYESSVKPGEVASTRPAAGAPATATAVLVVSEAPSSVLLSDLEAARSDCSMEDAELGGSTATGALVCFAAGSPVRAEYRVNDRVTSLQGTLGVADGAPARARARLVVRRGGRVLATLDAGAPREVDVPLAGSGSTIVLELSSPGAGSEDVEVVLGDARIAGARSGIDALTSASAP